MPDRESVITHLQIIHTWAEFARERDLQFFTAKHLEDIAKWSDDAIELLKEQQEQIDKLLEESASNAEMAEGMKELLKEQEAAPIKADKPWNKYNCPACNAPLHRTTWFTFQTRFCKYCGQAVKWE